MKTYKFGFLTLLLVFLFLFLGLLNAAEPEPTPSKEELTLLSNQTVPDAFEKLKNPGVFVNSDLLGSGIKSAFSGREEEAIDYAINMLRSPRVQIIDGKQANRSVDFRLAKMIFKHFQNEALIKLEAEYNNGNPLLRCNIIQMLGTMDKQEKARQILLSALSDTSVCEEDGTQEEGIPLRVCDAAYNQLILRHQFKGVLRNIATTHKIEDRDYHIGILKDKLKGK